jgi:hypothetical protein
MYIATVVALMLVFPLLSIGVDVVARQGTLGLPVVGKWFVFWSVGVRLLLAGARQIVRPQFTAAEILGLKSSESYFLVRELGFANVALGIVAALSLFKLAWVLPMAIAGGVFYGLAGVHHVMHDARNRLQNIAMVTDLYMAAVLMAFACITIANDGQA